MAGSRLFMPDCAGVEVVAARHGPVARRGAHVGRLCADAVWRDRHALSREESAHVFLRAVAFFDQPLWRKPLGVSIAVGDIWRRQRLGALFAGPPFTGSARGVIGLRLDDRLLSPRLVFAKRARLYGIAFLHVAGHIAVAGIARSRSMALEPRL